MTLSNNEATRIKEAMREQRKSDLWLAMRNARITSSRFGELAAILERVHQSKKAH